MNQQTAGESFIGILLVLGVLGLVALVIGLFIAAVVGANKKGNGSGAAVLGVLLALGLGAVGLMFFLWMFTAHSSVEHKFVQHDFGPGAQLQVINHQPTAEPFLLLSILVVGGIAVLVLAGLVAAIRKGGGWGVLAAVLLGVPVLLILLLFGFRFAAFSGTTAAVADASWDHSASSGVEVLHEMPLIEMAPLPPPQAVAGDAVAEVSDWSHEVTGHGHAADGHLDGAHVDDVHGVDGHDAHGEYTSHDSYSDNRNGKSNTLYMSKDMKHEGISHAPIILSKLPENYPDWIDRTDGEWDASKNVWTQTVQIGPYDSEAECQRNIHEEVREATKDFAEWHVASIDHADAAIRNYNPDDLPGPWLSIRSYGSRSNTEPESNRRYETRSYRSGHARETYHTTVETSVSDDPMHIIFARVEFSQEYRDELNRSVRHGLSMKRAIKAGSMWGIGLLGLVVTLGGLRMAGANAEPGVVSASAIQASPEPTTAESPRKPFLTKKRFMLILAPVICTVIYQINYMQTAEGLFGGQSDTFWPVWVWFGCGIAFVLTFAPGSSEKNSWKAKNK